MESTENTEETAHDWRWMIADREETAAADLAVELGVSQVVASILLARGFGDPTAARAFLDPDLDRDWADPGLIPGMPEAADRVARAVRQGESVVVFGDFDLDGISSAAVAARGLEAFGCSVRAIVPNRFREGYGLTSAALERLRALAPDLVVTVDCGISSRAEVARLAEWGIDVVITDHHEPGDDVPLDVPVANPKLARGCPSAALAGAGVALKLIQATGALLGQPDVWRDLTDLAMLGTIADVVPLTGENRALVAAGLALSHERPRVSIAALAAVAGVSAETLTSENVAFALAPRLNAAGRMAEPEEALRLLLSTDPVETGELARNLDEHNRYRQRIEQDLSDAAIALAEREYAPGDRAIVLAGEGWHEGVKGIVASRLASLFGVPVILFAVDGDEAQGSGRSVGSVDLFATVSALSDMLVRFGGHEAAVGVTIRTGDIPEFRRRLLEALSALPIEAFECRRTCDASIALDDVSVELAAELAMLEPFGHANPRPLFCADGVFMNSRQRVGKASTHLRFVAYNGVTSVPAIAFRCRDIERMANHDASVDLAFEISADEWRGKRRVQLLIRDFEIRTRSLYAPAAELVEDLFEHADEIIAREEYAGIADAESFHTKLAGVTFEGRQDVAARLEPGTPLRTRREPENPHDTNAISLFEPGGEQLGFFNRRLAAVLAPVIDAGVDYDVEVADVTGGSEGRSLGVNVLVARRGESPDELGDEERAARRDTLAALPSPGLESELTRVLIGGRDLHAAQQEALDALGAGQRCLAVMATGRGKSLIFHLHAARRALKDRVASVFVFPLRALVADQAFHLREVFSEMGLDVRTLTGESSPSTRDETFAALTGGTLDVVLTTPEFLEHHAMRFAATGRVGFVVIDEAHHVGTSGASHRPAYGRLGEALALLGSPDVLAVTATAGPETAVSICDVLGIQTIVTDPTVRDNLIVEDRREQVDKDGYVAALAATGEKVIVYVNSREQSVRIARMLRKRVPGIGMRVAFYNGGLGRSARHAVERAFRDGDLDLVVSTSAFGEGVNIPDVRHVVLYHMPFNHIEFNQMSGRVGRDGAPARVHLLFGSKDARINEMILSCEAPGRDEMGALYLTLKELQAEEGEGFEITNAVIAERTTAKRKGPNPTERTASSAIGVFRELGLVHSEGHGAYRRLTVLPRPEKDVALDESVRYAEGLELIEGFAQFKEWVLGAPTDVLLQSFNRPILP
jgi:single-stranded-DNA-specific exonuclease